MIKWVTGGRRGVVPEGRRRQTPAMKELRKFPYELKSPVCVVSWPSPNDNNQVSKLFEWVYMGKLQKLKKALSPVTAPSVETANKQGQTLLFCAAIIAQWDVCDLLLSLGADPNRRCFPGGYTPVHAACYIGCIKTFKILLKAGGDLRLCDAQFKRPIEWCTYQSDFRKRKSIAEAIDRLTQYCVEDLTSWDTVLEVQKSLTLSSPGWMMQKMRNFWEKTVSKSIPLHEYEVYAGGFGQVYIMEHARTGTLQHFAVPGGTPYSHNRILLDLESERDSQVATWISAHITQYVPKVWKSRGDFAVTVRELRKIALPNPLVDILISELEVLTKFKHPNLIWLLGVWQPSYFQLNLIYERISQGSLFILLHELRQRFSKARLIALVLDVIKGLSYLHSESIIHGGLTSHAIMLTEDGIAKIGNLEFSVPMGRPPNPVLCSKMYLWTLCHWMPLEILDMTLTYSVQSDIYSLCCILWETCYGKIPFSGMHMNDIVLLQQSEHGAFQLDPAVVPVLWRDMLKIGLQHDVQKRDIGLDEITGMCKLAQNPKDIQGASTREYAFLNEEFPVCPQTP